jgi:AraC family transcriptional regulator of adaptative response / DNA-3-methyladenine glycosylase II
LKDRAVLGVEHVDGDEYRRTFRADGRPGWLSVTPSGPRSLRLELHVAPTRELGGLIARIRRLFDLDARPHAIAERLRSVPRIARLVDARPGLRVPGAFDGFELAVRAVLGQQVSVRAATTLGGRLVARFGDASGIEQPGLDRLFPPAERLAGAGEQALISIGLTSQRARTIQALAAAVAEGRVSLAPSADPAREMEAMQALPGIGPWTAHYVAMRALRWPDAFPSGDLVVKKALGVDSARAAEEAAEGMRPWRSYAVMHLWASLA